MSRIKLRVTAGVFEVILVRVVEETSSVEDLWDRGVKREFKWRSVVFGDTDNIVGQKPTEAALEPPRTSSSSVAKHWVDADTLSRRGVHSCCHSHSDYYSRPHS